MMNLRNISSASTFSNYIASCLLVMAISICSFGLAYASEKTQSFSSDWTVNPWDYYGDIAAMDWHYIEYELWDSALGELREVRVQTEISGERESRTEDVRIRYAFSTGWSPADHQLSTTFYIPAGDKAFSISNSFVYDSPEEVQQWVSYDYVPPAHYYFESRTVDAGQTINAVTTLTFIYDSSSDQQVLELVDLVLNYEESSAFSRGTSNVLLRDLDQVMTSIDQSDMQGACDGMVTFINTTEELASKGGMELGAAMLLVAEADQIKADLYCS
jgi:hypothetical protein